MISERHRAIFIHIPKTAGTSVEMKLGLFANANRGVQDHRSLREIRPLSLFQHASCLLKPMWKEGFSRWAMLREMLGFAPAPGVMSQRVTHEQFRIYIKFAIVRNPWARVYSWYYNVMHDPSHGIAPCDFSTFLHAHAENWALRPQTWWIKDFDGSIPLDRIVRFENLAEEMADVLRQLGIADPALPHVMKGRGHGDYRAAYTDALAQLIADRYQEEIALFSYRFDDLKGV